jgi:hypothetical protein
VTDAATAVTHAEFGAFFYNVIDAKSGEASMLYTLSGAPKEAFEGFPQPRAFEFIARIRASTDADIRDIPAAALTAFARSEDRRRLSMVSKCILRSLWTPASWLPRLHHSSAVIKQS